MVMTHRRKWYISFGIVLLGIIALLCIIHAHILAILGFVLILGIIAIYDMVQKKHTILRNFPILGHMRFILEFFRPEIQQYFVASDTSERPYDRNTRGLIYQRSKGVDDTTAFGTDHEISKVGYEWVSHSLSPKQPSEVEDRLTVGSHQCTRPYSASRLNISAMSFGSLSKNAVEAFNKAAYAGNFYQNTGEGGLTDHHLHGGDIVFQIGTGYFGVRDKETGGFDEQKFKEKSQIDSVKMIEIKLSQGAKPAHGGVLPASKISPEIADIRQVKMGEDVISPPAHSAFSGPDGLCHFVQRLRELSDGKPIGFKLCIGRKSGFISICKAIIETGIYPDFITIDGAEGGTGAAPLEYTNHIGMPLKDALLFVNNTLIGFGIRDQISIIVSGKVATGFDMVRKIAMGADICNVARPMMMSIGCIQSRQCNKNTCPVGVATQNPKLYKKLDVEDKRHRAHRYHDATVHSFMEMIGAMGLTNPSDLHPAQILKRTDIDTIKSYAEIYPTFKGPILLDGNTVPEHYKPFWDRASATSFAVDYDSVQVS